MNIAVLGAGAGHGDRLCARNTTHRRAAGARRGAGGRHAHRAQQPSLSCGSHVSARSLRDRQPRCSRGPCGWWTHPHRNADARTARREPAARRREYAQPGGMAFGRASREADHLLAHEVVARTWPDAIERSGPLSGPSFALEVARGLPTARTVAGSSGFCERVTDVLHLGALRIYSSPDVVGVEVGGTVKNVLAIATGISDALELGLNARAALITRGLAEMTRLGDGPRRPARDLHGPDRRRRPDPDGDRRSVAQSADRTCARSRTVDRADRRRTWTCRRGRASAPAVLARAREAGVQMPITEAVCAVLAGGATPRQALERLLARDPKRESEGQ